MDLVSAAGVNTDDWGNYKGGPQKAAANPKYCYEWAFVEPDKVVVLNLWHKLFLEGEDGRLFRKCNFKKEAETYGRLKSIWKTRYLKMDDAIQHAFKNNVPVRAIVCSGSIRGIDLAKNEALKVEKRLLDPVPWTVTFYDWNTGECTLTRDV